MIGGLCTCGELDSGLRNDAGWFSEVLLGGEDRVTAVSGTSETGASFDTERVFVSDDNRCDSDLAGEVAAALACDCLIAGSAAT